MWALRWPGAARLIDLHTHLTGDERVRFVMKGGMVHRHDPMR